MRYYRRVIRIRATDSPNVRLGLLQQQRGGTPTDEIVVPGILSWSDYCKRTALWDEPKRCVSLDAEFWEGAEAYMFPKAWLMRCREIARQLAGRPRRAKAIGVDPAEGGAETAWAASDEFGLVELLAKQTVDTNVITGETLAFARRHSVPAESVVFDRGGGGKQHADRLRAQGFAVRTVAFGEPPSMPLRHGMRTLDERRELLEERYVYKNRRSQMYGDLRLLMEAGRYAIDAKEEELFRQLEPIPLLYDNEGRLELLPKGGDGGLVELLGCSPDRADAVVLSVHGILHRVKRITAGAVVA
jgi:hypothetical protein